MNPLETAAAGCAWAGRPVAEKLLLFGGLLLCAVTLPPRQAGPVVLVAVTLAVALARVPARVYLGALVGPLVFVALGVVPLAVDVVGGLRGGAWVPPGGVDRAVDTAWRATSASAATIGLACTTPLASLLGSARRLGVPGPLCHVADMTYRLLGILLATARALRDSVDLRLGLRSRRGAVAALGGQFATVFVHGMLRARRIEESMSLRAEPGESAVTVRSAPVSVAHVAATLVVLGVVVAAGLLPGWWPR